jgi:hypothetical protein
MGTRTRDLPACSIVPQPTTLPRAEVFVLTSDMHAVVGTLCSHQHLTIWIYTGTQHSSRHSSHQPLMKEAETVSETSNTISTVIGLITRQPFALYSTGESFKSYAPWIHKICLDSSTSAQNLLALYVLAKWMLHAEKAMIRPVAGATGKCI